MSRAGLTTRDRGRSVRTVEPPRRPTPTLRVQRPSRLSTRRRRALRIAVATLLLVTAAWVLWASPLLAVHSIQVDGVTTLAAGQVREAAGIADDTPLLRVDVAAARARVARLPQVAAVEVTRGWPDRVVITVVERRPVAVVEEPGRRTLVDAEGVLFDTISGAPPVGVVRLDVPHPGPDDAATTAALTAVREFPRDLSPKVARVTATPDGEVTVYLADDTTVQWGPADDSRAKAVALDALLAQIASGALEPAATIDVSSPTAVVLR
jgi:cell division septal protein FtsQ